MKIKTLLLLTSFASAITSLQAQKSEKKITGYAITAPQKGQTGWKEVRLVDIKTGEELQTIYKGTDETEALNARTGKPVIKKDKQPTAPASSAKIVNLDEELSKSQLQQHVRVYTQDADKKLQELKINQNSNLEELKKYMNNNVVVVRREFHQVHHPLPYDKPFATNSAAMAYDKKHERLYYTPMNINQLRYIDLKGKTAKVYYFEDEPFGTVTGMGDVANQITRMVIASDGNGYALTNDGNHLIKFTTGKKPVITDLGVLTDDAKNGNNTVHSRGGYGGDMIADAAGNLYLITASRNVFKISIQNKTANYLGNIRGLPKGFSTNGAMVEEGSKVIVASSESTAGYYRFDLTTLQAERISNGGAVFNASDLANGNLAFAKKKKDDKKDEPKTETAPAVPDQKTAKQDITGDEVNKNGIAVFPNPVTNGTVRISFAEQPAGRYHLELLDMSGRLIKAKEVNINSTMQVEEFSMPELSVKGNYLLKVSNAGGKISVTKKILIQ